MVSQSVALIDYGMGNLRSVSKALELSGATVRWVDKPSELKRYDAMVLPGVGAFSVAVKNLKKRKLFHAIQEWVDKKKPFLGICLGYQLLFEKSDEGGRETKGLSLFSGRVNKLIRKGNLRIPHMGWNRVFQKKEVKNKKQDEKKSCFLPLTSDIFSGIPEGAYFYFVHSYIPEPQDKSIIATTTDYGISFASSIRKSNLFASQFHPEKSGEIGLKLLRGFLKLC